VDGEHAGRRRTADQESCHTINRRFDALESHTGDTIRLNGTEPTFPELTAATDLQGRPRLS
jgi:hypothetical protein